MSNGFKWCCLAFLLVARTASAGEGPIAGDAQYFKGGRSVGPLIEVPMDKLGLNPYARESTAHQFVRDRNLQGMVGSAVGSSDLIMAVTTPEERSPLVDRGSSSEGVFAKVVFHDGSSVVIRVDQDHANGRYERGSARSAAGVGLADGI
ncbi:hypothetical protein [uncultured Stenotrophomonas sp.]|uniref:hypothetical protein n=1 Tax=uncultured Stenotrophomonas sp. TaxID=165438 RepID=UPI0028E538B2|nr:hypothetical protein [uncultured Stenotrophomonas sp.]